MRCIKVSNKTESSIQKRNNILTPYTRQLVSEVGLDWLNYWTEDIGLLYCQTIEVEQMMACLLAEMRSNWEMLANIEAKAYANLKEMKTEIRTNQEKM
jgi:hypothetical protein